MTPYLRSHAAYRPPSADNLASFNSLARTVLAIEEHFKLTESKNSRAELLIGRFLPLLPGVCGLPAEIIIGRKHCESRFEVFQLLGKAERQPVEPLQENPLGSVQAFGVLIVRHPTANGTHALSRLFERPIQAWCHLYL